MVKKATGKTIADLNRHQLGSIDLKDLEDVSSLSVAERDGYVQNAENLWQNPVFQNEIMMIIQKQLEFIGMKAETFEQVIIARGTINGVDLFKQRIEQLHGEYIQKHRPSDKFDKFSVDGAIDE